MPPDDSRRLTPVWVNSWNTVKQPGSVRKVCYNGKSVSKGRPPLATSPNAHATTENTPNVTKPNHFQHHMRKLQQSLKYFLKKIPKGYGLCCLTIMLAVSMYKLIWFSPSTDSEVVTALGWGRVHVTVLRRGQVVCLVDGGTLRLLSQVPGLEDKRKRAIRGTIWKVTYFRSSSPDCEIGIYIRNEVGEGRGFSGTGREEW